MRVPSPLKGMMQRASYGVTLRRRLPPAFGGARILVTPESMLRLWRPQLVRVDPPLFASAYQFVKPGDIVWDVGANVGLFSFASSWMSGPSGLVLSFEPDIWLASMMQRSAADLPGGYAKVHVLSVAIADRADMAHLTTGKEGRATNHLCEPAQSDKGCTTLVPTVTLDWLRERLPKPSVLKIDVEGAEARVLKGSVQLLLDSRPLILCEVAEENADVVSSILHDCGYSLFDNEGSCQVERAPFNTIAIPQGVKRTH